MIAFRFDALAHHTAAHMRTRLPMPMMMMTLITSDRAAQFIMIRRRQWRNKFQINGDAMSIDEIEWMVPVQPHAFREWMVFAGGIAKCVIKWRHLFFYTLGRFETCALMEDRQFVIWYGIGSLQHCFHCRRRVPAYFVIVLFSLTFCNWNYLAIRSTFIRNK